MLINRNDNLLLFVGMMLAFASHDVSAKNKTYFEELFSTAVVLTDSDTITLGVGNFDPDKLLKPHEQEVSESDSIKLRNELTVYTVPYTWLLSDSKSNKKPVSFFDKDELTVSLSYIKQKTTTDLLSQSITMDDDKDEIYSAYFAYSKHSQLNEYWNFRLRIGSYLMHHENTFSYNSQESQQYQDKFDGVFLNLSANAFIIEPNIKLSYSKSKDWGKWQYISDLNVFTGKTFNGVESSQDAEPQGWRLNNTLKAYYALNKSTFHAESLYVKFQRSDIGGDMVNNLGTDHFYEVGVGILLDTSKFTDLANNVGIGINIHKGSNLNGGSIVFYFNEL